MALTDNLVAAYKFNSGALTTDSSGNAKTLTAVGTPTDGTGKSGNGATVSSGNAFSRATPVNADNGDFTISIWVKLTNEIGSAFYTFAAFTTANLWIYFRYDYNGGTRRLQAYVTGGTYTGANYNVSLGTAGWHHICLVRTQSTGNFIIYLDGSNVANATDTSATTGNSKDFYLASGSGNNYIDGVVDEAYFWDRALSSTEITTLYNSGNGSFYPFNAAYTLAMAQASFTETGNATLLTHGAKLVSAYGAFTLTGRTILLALGKKMTAAYASFVLTGNDVVYKFGKVLSAVYGSFILTGQALTLKTALSTTLSYGSFALTGIATGLKRGYTLTAQYASYVLTGIAASLLLARRYALAAATFTLTGIALVFGKAVSLVASTGRFTVTGFNAILKLVGWLFDTKHTNSWSEDSRNTDTWTLDDKN